MTSPAYGLIFNRDNTDPRPSQPSDLSVIGLVLPADDADASAFPLNEPVALDSGDATALAKLGSNNDLLHAVLAIDDQLTDLQTSARIVATRVAKGANDNETIANIIGSRTAATAAGHVGTGLYSLLRAGSQLGVIPRLLGAPGYTWQTTMDASNNVLANPICAALPSVCDALLAHAVIGGPGTGLTDATAWFQTLTSGRLIAIDAWRSVQDATATRLEDGVAAVLGLGVRVDFKHGGYPFWSFSGQQVHGTIGLKNYYPFSLVDGATTGQELLAARIGVIERGEMGVETAISSNGFVFAGVWNADTDPNWRFYNKSRGRDFAHLALLKSIRLRLGVNNVSPHGVQAVLNDMVAVGQDLINHEVSVGFRVGFEASKNSPDDLRQGKFRVFFATEEPAPITQVTIDSRPNYEALSVELGTLVAQAASLPAVYLA
jgi:phage tail sheath protein FI